MSKNSPTARLLKKNKLTRSPQYFCFVDTETLLEKVKDNKTVHNFRLGVAYFVRFRKDGKRNQLVVLRFGSIDEFWVKVDTFLRGKNTLHIIAHNALFDMTVLKFRSSLTAIGFDCCFLFDQSLTFISKWRNEDRRIMILDNSNWFKGKLSKWGEKLELPKMVMPEFTESDEVWYDYCERDTKILYRLQLWWIEFLKDNVASASFNAYRHRFMPYPIYIPKKTRETYLARMSYKGGRTECFYSGKLTDGPYYKLDINSMYPYTMKINEYPTSVEGYMGDCSLSDVVKALKHHCVIGKFRIKCNEAYFPIKINDKTCYPIGEFDCYLSTPEIVLCRERGWLLDCYEFCWYRKRSIFTEFVDFFYDERMKHKEQGNELASFLFKTLLNSLYGKFGQRGFNDAIIGSAEPGTFHNSTFFNRVTGEKGYYRQIGRNIIRSSKNGEGYDAFCAIASHVTAHARMYLGGLLSKVGRDNLYYCDTDSIITNVSGYTNLSSFMDNDRIGALKVEGKADTLEIVSPKHYGFGKQWAVKGVSQNSERTKDGGYIQEIWPGVSKILDGDKEQYFNYTIVKHLVAKVSSGVIGNDGRVRPFNIG
jgi:hypothetical protein